MGIALYEPGKQVPLGKVQGYTKNNALDVGTYTQYQLTKITPEELDRLYFSGSDVRRLVAGVDYTITGDVITLTVGLDDWEFLTAIAASRLETDYIGEADTDVTVYGSIILRNTGETDITDAYITTELTANGNSTLSLVREPACTLIFTPNQIMKNKYNANVSGLLVTGFITPITAHAAQGMIAVINGQYMGYVIANSSTAILLGYTAAAYAGVNGSDSLELFFPGYMKFSLSPDGPFTAILPLAPFVGDLTVYFQDIQYVWGDPYIYTDQAIRVSYREFIS